MYTHIQNIRMHVRMCVYMCVYMYVCIYVCVYVSIYVCVCMSLRRKLVVNITFYVNIMLTSKM